MVVLGDFFDLFDERREFAAFLPAATFAYLYHLSREPSFIFVAIIFSSTASANIARESSVTSNSTYGHIKDFLYLGPILINVFVGFPAAILASWNNIIKRNLAINISIEYIGIESSDIIFEKVVTSPDIILTILFFLNAVYMIIIAIKIVIFFMSNIFLKIYWSLKTF